MIRTLYPSLGFTEVQQAAPAEGATRWFLDLANYVVRDTHIFCESNRMIHQEILSKFTRILRDLLLDELDRVDDGNAA